MNACHCICHFAIVPDSLAVKLTPNVTILMKYIKHFIDKYTLLLRGATAASKLSLNTIYFQVSVENSAEKQVE